MAEVITRMTASELDECLDILNGVFGRKNEKEMDFKALFPRLMQPTDEAMRAHHCIKVDGKVAGLVASYPLTLKYGELSLYVCGSGNVAVLEEFRGKGYMSTLLKHTAVEDKKDGFAFSYFHGSESRYRRFGYHKCGVQCSFDINIKMFDRDLSTDGIIFQNLLTQNDDILKKAYTLYQTQYHFERDFTDYKSALPSNGGQKLAVMKQGEFIGYIIAEGNNIKALYLEHLNDFAAVLKAYLIYKNISTTVLILPDTEFDLMRVAIKYAESYRMWPPANFRIYDFKKTVEFFLNVKLKNQPMDGSFTIDSDIFGKWKISVENGVPNVTKFDGKADFTVNGLDIYDFLFGGNDAFRPNLTKDAAAILPIPIYCPYLN